MYVLYVQHLGGDDIVKGVERAAETFLTDEEWKRLQNRRAMQRLGAGRLGGGGPPPPRR